MNAHNTLTSFHVSFAILASLSSYLLFTVKFAMKCSWKVEGSGELFFDEDIPRPLGLGDITKVSNF